MKELSIALVVAVVLAGCGETTPIQTVAWYKQHDTEREEMIAKCTDNPGELAASPNCINAQKAQNENDLSRRGYLKLPPADLGRKGE